MYTGILSNVELVKEVFSDVNWSEIEFHSVQIDKPEEIEQINKIRSIYDSFEPSWRNDVTYL